MSRKFRIPWGAVLGVALVLAGLCGLYSGPEISQYVFLPSEAAYETQMTAAEEKWAGAFDALSLHGVAERVSLTARNGGSQGDVTLYEVRGGYFEIYPRAFPAGRTLNRGDGKNSVIVLDSELAFRLFADRDPLGEIISIGEAKYEVVGVARAQRRIGETGQFAAWIPLGADGAPTCSVMVLSAGGSAGESMRTVFETGASEIFGQGEAFFLNKERTRGTVMLRFVVIVTGIFLLVRWVSVMGKWIRKWTNEISLRLRSQYPREMIGIVLLRSLQALGLCAITVLVGAGIVMWGAELMTVFPEWVPENLVSPEAIAQRFWELTGAAARPLQFRTPELAEIRLWSGFVRWGIVVTLLSLVLARKTGVEKPRKA